LVLCPSKTHAGFIELLLAYRDQLEETGNLPFFDREALASISRRNSSSNSNGALQSPRSATPGLSSDNFFSYSMMDPAVYPHSNAHQGFNYYLPDNQFNAPDMGLEFVPRTEKKLARERPDITIQTSSEAKKPRYSLGKPPLPPNLTSYFSHSNTVTSLNDDFSGLFAPTQGSFPSFDIVEATKLYERNYGNEHEQFFNDFENNYLTKDDTLPDLGPFYQPLNVNGIDFTL
jgi:hypothetical protein